ncbi:MAG: TIGR03364 family FAD-dependent oxidoreductase [Alphaproteobacteria bacterium]|jgi:FAD dependent oxidoreductase TIGR03364|nr:TIGR03364 family FAD-dependent oxidoreductase [Alphaproteobacteria bacterium]
MERSFDLAVVGAGIVGLAHALAAARKGLRVLVLDREAEAIGASVRNFGFVTVTGQAAGETWRRALRTRDVWDEVAPRAGIPIEQRGLVVAARRPEAMAVLEAFKAGEMGADCALLTRAEATARVPALRAAALEGALWSPHERRVESRTAIPRLAGWLEAAMGVTIHRSTHVHAAGAGRLETSRGRFTAERIVVCPGDERLALFPERFAALGIARVRLHMMKVMPAAPAPHLAAAVMSDLSLVRYLGWAALPAAAALARRLDREEAGKLAQGIHLIAVQGADGGLVVGDSHHHEPAPSPFAADDVDRLILAELDAVLALGERRVVERWQGTYAHLPDRRCVIDAPEPAVRLVVVTSGTGASTAFALGEEVIDDLFGRG